MFSKWKLHLRCEGIQDMLNCVLSGCSEVVSSMQMRKCNPDVSGKCGFR